MALEPLVEALGLRLASERARIDGALDATRVSHLAREEFSRLTESLDSDSEAWKAVVPGKPLLGKFSHLAGLKSGHAKSLYIKAARLSDRDPFSDLDAIFKRFVAA